MEVNRGVVDNSIIESSHECDGLSFAVCDFKQEWLTLYCLDFLYQNISIYGRTHGQGR